MENFCHYQSPLGDILLTVDHEGLSGLWFEGQKNYPGVWGKEDPDQPTLKQTRDWLDVYFSGREPDFRPPLHYFGTPFQMDVWRTLLQIPYGETVTYGEVASLCGRGSAISVGGAVGRNRISILIPCHRVVGADGSLTGYAGGLERKAALLKLENAWKESFFIP